MCGRYTIARHEVEVPLETENVHVQLRLRRYNVAPTQTAPVIRMKEGHAVVDELRWGLIPFWAKDGKIAFQGINARSETVADKPMFRAAFKQRRCLIPADGFYEWLPEGKLKLPFRFVRPDGSSFVFAGLWESWQPKDAPVAMETFTILTTTPSQDVAPIHDRMPVILDSVRASHWLRPEATKEELLSLLVSAPNGYLNRVRVNPVVNSARNDTAECIEAIP
jgi:putative SOS response-associated peptidase YedK